MSDETTIAGTGTIREAEIETGEFQATVTWKPDSTKEAREACLDFIKEALDSANGTDGIPDAIESFKFERIKK